MTKATKTARKATKTAKKMMTPSAKKRKKGFTLIELLIVVGILAVVAAVAIPNLTRFMGSGKEESFDADKAAIQTACDAFYYENGVYPIADNGATPSTAVIFNGDGVDGTTRGVDLNGDGDCVDNAATTGTYDEWSAGLVDLNYTVDIPKSSDEGTNGGSYTWAIGSNGEVTTVYVDDTYP
jgi:prepilin-type N-terminal cleavage/methylation domain-containing protein